ncbi:MAG: hypothetical protein ABJ363_14685 [Alphaproteobacteria bacterium]
MSIELRIDQWAVSMGCHAQKGPSQAIARANDPNAWFAGKAGEINCHRVDRRHAQTQGRHTGRGDAIFEIQRKPLSRTKNSTRNPSPTFIKDERIDGACC